MNKASHPINSNHDNTYSKQQKDKIEFEMNKQKKQQQLDLGKVSRN